MPGYGYPSQRKFEKIFRERVGRLLIDSGFTYTKKFHCYYRYISEDILQVFSNRIYERGSQWEDYVGVFPLCEPDDVLMAQSITWASFYANIFSTEKRTAFWDPRIKAERGQLLAEEFQMNMEDRLKRCRDTLENYVLPRLDRIRTFADYMDLLQEMPQYTANRQTMGPLLGRYGTMEEIEARIEQYKKEEEKVPSGMKKWRAAEVEQYSQIKEQRLQKGPESFDPVLRRYAQTKRERLNAEAEMPLQGGRNMGTTGGCFGILSDGLTKEQLRERLGKLPPEEDAVFIWKEGAKWLPYVDDTLGDAIAPDPQGSWKLSQKLDAPALVFSLFDSDVLFLYYTDAKAGISQQYARANSGLFCEVLGLSPEEMPGGPREDLPEFLLPYCDGKKLRKLWEREDYVFADERLTDLCGLLGSAPLEDPDNLPEGFEELRP